MGLFDQIVSAIDNPSLQASAGQLGGILNTVQSLSSGTQGANSESTQAALGVVGKHVRSALQAQPSNGQAQSLVNQFSGTGANPQAVNALFSEGQQQQMVQEISRRTGLDSKMIVGMLPMLVPLVLNLLNSGSQNQDPRQGGNPVLNSFLDSDGDGDVDVSDALRMAGQFLSKR
ncbi:MAG: hypothetical protein AAF329_06705 [Cyanobacteria bacterium P01_A01_bin.17]